MPRQIVTGWFRTPPLWPLLAAHLEPLRPGPITVYSGGTGDGREAYSLAILLLDLDLSGQVIATDLRPDLVATARVGTYDGPSTRDDLAAAGRTPERRYLAHNPYTDAYTVRAAVRERVTFQVSDLSADPIPRADLAVVRNCWRWLDADGQAHLARELHTALRPAGRLVIGAPDLVRLDYDEQGRLQVTATPPAGFHEHFVEAGELLWRPRKRPRPIVEGRAA